MKLTRHQIRLIALMSAMLLIFPVFTAYAEESSLQEAPLPEGHDHSQCSAETQNTRGISDPCPYGGTHSFVYERPDQDLNWENYHIIVCEKCLASDTQSHSFRYTPLSEYTHRRTCSKCGFFDLRRQHQGFSCHPFAGNCLCR